MVRQCMNFKPGASVMAALSIPLRRALQRTLELCEKRDHSARSKAGFVETVPPPLLQDRQLICVGRPTSADIASTPKRCKMHVEVRRFYQNHHANRDAVTAAPLDLLSDPTR